MGVTKYATDEVKERIAKKKKKQGEAEAKIGRASCRERV